MLNKICSKCGQEKPLSDFCRAKDGKNGRRSICKACGLLWTKKNQDNIRLRHKQERLKLKVEVLTHYGNGTLACVVCGENRVVGLTIDHIEGGGSAHRRSIGRYGISFYRWLRQQSYPRGYQTLCMTCQFIKRAERNEFYNEN